MRRFPFFRTTLIALVAVCLSGSAAYAGDEIDEEQVAAYAVQSRLFRLGGELRVEAGFLPINAFNKGLTVGGSFTYHFSNCWAWEIIRGAYVYKQLDTGLKGELLDNFKATPTDITAVDFILSSGVLITPFYGKLAVLNRRVIHLEVSIPVGGAMVQYINPKARLAGPDLGLMFRVFISPHISFSIDARDYVFMNKHWNTRNEVLLALGLAFAWGGDER